MSTFLELKTFVRQNIGNAGDTVTDDVVARAVKSGLRYCGNHRAWNFLKDQNPLRLNLTAPYSTGTVSVSIGSTSLTGSGTVFPSNVVGQPIRIDNNSPFSVISARGGDTALTLAAAYSNENQDAASGAGYEIYFPQVDVTARTKALNNVRMASRQGQPLCQVTWDAIWQMYNDSWSSGEPVYWALWEGSLDTDAKKLAVYPAPSLAFSLDATRYRLPTVPSLDADVLDWKDEYLTLLQAAALMAAGTEFAAQDAYARGQAMWQGAIRDAIVTDEKTSSGFTLSGRPRRGRLTGIGGPYYRADGTTFLGD